MKNYLLLLLVILFTFTSCGDDEEVDRTVGIAPTSIVISGAVDLATDDASITMSAEVLPTNVSNPLVTWFVDNKSIATINDKTGVLKAVSNGTVTVTSKTNGTPNLVDKKTIVISNQIVSLGGTEWILVSKDGVAVVKESCEAGSMLVFEFEKLADDAPDTQAAKIDKVTQSDFIKNSVGECVLESKVSDVTTTKVVTGLVTTGSITYAAIPGIAAVPATPGTVATDTSPGTPPTNAIPAVPAVPSVTVNYTITKNEFKYSLDGVDYVYKVK